MGQYVLGILETLDHFKVGGLHGTVQGIGASLALFVYVGHHFGLRAEHDFCVVLEVDLHDLVGETEHDGVARSHPLLDVDHVLHLSDFWSLRIVLFKHSLGLVVTLKITPEVLQ